MESCHLGQVDVRYNICHCNEETLAGIRNQIFEMSEGVCSIFWLKILWDVKVHVRKFRADHPINVGNNLVSEIFYRNDDILDSCLVKNENIPFKHGVTPYWNKRFRSRFGYWKESRTFSSGQHDCRIYFNLT